MKIRKGLGKGMGMGYKNLIPMDSHIHSLSAKGVKSKRPMLLYAKNDVSSADIERLGKLALDRDDITAKDLKEMEDKVSGKVEEIEDWYDNDDFLLVKFDDGSSWVVAPSEDDAEELAKEQVRRDLEDEPELFTQDWLQNYMSMTDTDRRIIAGEESDRYVEDMDDDSLLEEAGEKEEYDEIQDEIDELESQDNVDEDKVSELEDKQQDLIERSKETVRDEKYDEIYDALEDPVEYFVEEQGIYTREELMKQGFIHIDIDEATEDAVSTDGWAHFISRYDGNYDVLESGKVIWRED